MGDGSIRLLLQGIDTLQCAYYLTKATGIDFERLSIEKGMLRGSKSRNPLPIDLGNSKFLLQPKRISQGLF